MDKENLLEKEEILAYQIDVFDNEANRFRANKDRPKKFSDFTISLRLETENTDGWLHLQSQITVGRKPSQTKRSIRTQVDMDIFKEMCADRDELTRSTSQLGQWEIKPTISSFYKKKCKSEGMIPSFYCIFMKEKHKPHGIYLRLGNWTEYMELGVKESDTHTIYSSQERFHLLDKFHRRGY